MLKIEFKQGSGPTVKVEVGDEYEVTDEVGSRYRDQVEEIVQEIFSRRHHGGAPSLFPLIWSSIKATFPNVKLVSLDPPPPEPDSEIPLVY